jgi:hypothetical protein
MIVAAERQMLYHAFKTTDTQTYYIGIIPDFDGQHLDSQ